MYVDGWFVLFDNEGEIYLISWLSSSYMLKQDNYKSVMVYHEPIAKLVWSEGLTGTVSGIFALTNIN